MAKDANLKLYNMFTLDFCILKIQNFLFLNEMPFGAIQKNEVCAMKLITTNMRVKVKSDILILSFAMCKIVDNIDDFTF